MKKKNPPVKAPASTESFNQSLNILANQLGLYVMLLRNASAKQQHLVDS